MPTTPKDFNVDSIRIVKVLGSGVEGSRVVRGMVFGKEPEGQWSIFLLHKSPSRRLIRCDDVCFG
jgi:chaperonin GroEL (HSP60 family)